MKNLKTMNNEQLLETLQQKSLAERRLTIEVIELLEEVERRSLHLEKGHGSLLEFCVRELRYSESAAYRRISAMRVAKEIPQVKQAIEKGSLNLVTFTQAQTFFRQEKKYLAKNYSTSEKIEVLKSLENRSKRAAEKILLERSPELPRAESIRQVAANETRVTLFLEQGLIDQLDRIKIKYSHRNPNPTYAELIALMAGEILALQNKKSSPLRQEQPKIKVPNEEFLAGNFTAQKTELAPEIRRNSAQSQYSAKPPEQMRSRYISRAVKHQVSERDDDCCSYQDPITNRKCRSRFQLEFDHVHPFSMNGSSELKNLRLLCRNHNQFVWRSRTQKNVNAAIP